MFAYCYCSVNVSSEVRVKVFTLSVLTLTVTSLDYCYHSINDISYGVVQSDPIKFYLLHNMLVLQERNQIELRRNLRSEWYPSWSSWKRVRRIWSQEGRSSRCSCVLGR